MQRKKRNLRSFQKGALTGVDKDTMKMGGSLAGVEQMQIDGSVQFDGVGGLSDHISSLKEMVIFPLLYPEIFETLKIEPPRGCLFYGPPGTGKTLLARALANECSQGDMRVTFFMRKGAECLSKWIGESERQLRLLFEQAYQMRPSIIFFDEIDALAPVRSNKQDQIHSSVVGTLLALMDGLASRGEVVVIGATNRLDSIDPALQRPGRFEREFRFSLPNKEARKEIFKIHTRDWNPKPSDNLLEELAEECVGYCGADIKALCAETGLCALRHRYPQLYESRERLQINMDSIKIKANDFSMAMQKTVPASRRVVPSPGRALSAISKPLLKNTLERILQTLQRVFPHAEKKLYCLFSYSSLVLNFSSYCCRNPRDQPTSYRPRFLLIEEPGSGQASDLAAAVIHSLEKFPVYTLDTPTLFASTSPDETCVQLMREAQRTAPSIIYVPQIPSWWETVGPTLRSVFTTLLQSIPRFTPVLLLATSNVQLRDLPEEIKTLFNDEYEEVFRIPCPTCAERRHFFEDLVMKQAAQPPPLEVLPVAPPPKPRKLTVEEIRQVEEQEEDTLRELRIYLRDVAQRLVIDKRFKAFTKPIDPEEKLISVDTVKQPMDLSTVLSKIDMHQYLTARDFLKDIDLICSNALEYNPKKGPGDPLLRHKACTLSDTAYSIVRHEMNEDFEQCCQKIKESRKERGMFFDAEHFKTCLVLCNQPHKTQFFAPQGVRKKKCNEKWKMPTVPVNASTPCSNGKFHFIQTFLEKVPKSLLYLLCSCGQVPVILGSSCQRMSLVASSCEAVIFLFGVAALLSYILTASHNTQLLNSPSTAAASLLVLLSQRLPLSYRQLWYISRMERLYALLSQCIYRHREDDDKTELVKVNFLSCSHS
uniref:Uncharacterized protein n=1 Tax=Corvus moneduloides TaxID=1196302 RepID=A0A8U7M2G9_CORMO